MLVVLLLFFGVPLMVVIAFSFFDFDGINTVPSFVWTNYQELFASKVTLSLYLKTIYYAVTVWAITLVIGFTVAYFLAFHVRSLIWQMALFLLCTVPFWTSNIIRMISWIPFLGRNGIFNQALMGAGLTHEPLEFLLFSDFAVITAYVHLFTLFMIVPIFNSMARIDRSIIEAAWDGGSSGPRTCRSGSSSFGLFSVIVKRGHFACAARAAIAAGSAKACASTESNVIASIVVTDSRPIIF